MYSIALMVALAQSPTVTQEPVTTYQEPVTYGEPARRGLFRGRFGLFRNRGMGTRSYQNGTYVSQPGSPTDQNYRSYYPGPTPGTPPSGPAPARMVVHLPPDASLTVDGNPTQSTTSTRVFITPALEPGKEYTYELKAQVTRPNGEVTATKKVRVLPGQDTDVVMNLPGNMSTTDNMAPMRRRILRR